MSSEKETISFCCLNHIDLQNANISLFFIWWILSAVIAKSNNEMKNSKAYFEVKIWKTILNMFETCLEETVDIMKLIF
jgi:hypothetical protein